MNNPLAVAWIYEMAIYYDKFKDEYSIWEEKITKYKPNVPNKSIRNLRPLYVGNACSNQVEVAK